MDLELRGRDRRARGGDAGAARARRAGPDPRQRHRRHRLRAQPRDPALQPLPRGNGGREPRRAGRQRTRRCCSPTRRTGRRRRGARSRTRRPAASIDRRGAPEARRRHRPSSAPCAAGASTPATPSRSGSGATRTSPPSAKPTCACSRPWASSSARWRSAPPSCEEAKARAQHLADHDALTGLPNRRLLEDRLTQALALSQRNRKQTAVMFVDLDRFKTINDSLGHAVGDALLKEVAGRLVKQLRDRRHHLPHRRRRVRGRAARGEALLATSRTWRRR